MRSKPAAHSPILQICVKAVGKVLFLCRVANEARIMLDRLIEQRGEIFDHRVRHPHAAKKRQWEYAGLLQASMINYARASMMTAVESDRARQICIYEFGLQ